MQAPKPLLTKHRRRRLVLRVLAMLTWIAAALFAGQEITYRQLRQRGRRMSLAGITRTVAQLMIVRAGEIARPRRRKRLRFWKHGRDLKRRHLIRSLIGSRLRRALKHSDVATRIAILIAVLRNLDAWSQHLAERMKRGLTRLWPISPTPTSADALRTLIASAPAPADSS